MKPLLRLALSNWALAFSISVLMCAVVHSFFGSFSWPSFMGGLLCPAIFNFMRFK